MIEMKRDFKGEAVVMDDSTFVDCTFTDCVLIYRGGEHSWLNCHMKGCRVILQGAAVRSQSFLEVIGWRPPEKPEKPELPDGSGVSFGPN